MNNPLKDINKRTSFEGENFTEINKETKSSSSFLNKLEKNSDIPAPYILSFLFLSGTLIFFKYLDMHLANVVGIVLPVYWTIKSFENPSESDDKQWITYWTIFFCLLSLDLLIPSLLSKIPLYNFIKFLFLMWLFMPNTQGALFIHNQIIARIFGPINISQKIRKVFNFFSEIQSKVDELAEKINKEKEELENKLKLEKEYEEKRRLENEKKEEMFKKLEEVHKKADEINYPEVPKISFDSVNNNFPSRPIEIPNSLENKDLSMFTSQSDIDKASTITNTSKQLNENDILDSRQNIVTNAKIDIDNFKAGLQNVKQEFSQSTERLIDLKESLSQPKPIDQQHLLDLGKDIAGSVRTNMDPNFKTYEEVSEGKEMNEKKISPLHKDKRTIDAMEDNVSQKFSTDLPFKKEEERKVL